jgi:hypothetical protein
MTLKWPVKDPDEVLDYQVDWTEKLATDTIATSTWIVPAGLTKDSDSNTPTKTTIWLSGGTPGEQYGITNRITTTGGRTIEQWLTIRVESAQGGLVSVQEVKGRLHIDTNDDDAALLGYIEAASAAVISYLKGQADSLLDLDSGGSPSPDAVVPAVISTAVIMLVGYWYRNPDGDPDKDFERGYLPKPVTALLYPLRDPAIA